MDKTVVKYSMYIMFLGSFVRRRRRRI